MSGVVRADGGHLRSRRGDVFIIAEAGVNHDGSLRTALELVAAAADAGADAVKFQTFRAETLVTADAEKASYQVERTGAGDQRSMLAALQLDEGDHEALMAECRYRGITFLSSPFDPDSARFLDRLDVAALKLPSGAVTDLPLLRTVATFRRPVILSTGMADLEEVRAAVRALEDAGLGRDHLTLMQCTTSYPAPAASANLRAMATMAQEFGVEVGYSDHTEGDEVVLAAVALGARVIEKHLTLDRSAPGPDHLASIEPDAFTRLVDRIRIVESALGDGVKAPSPVEDATRPAARLSIVAARPIAAGARIVAEDLAVRRPGTGLSPMRWDDVVGSVALRDYRPDEMVEL